MGKNNKSNKKPEVISEDKIDEILSQAEAEAEIIDPKSDAITDPVERELKRSYDKEKAQKKSTNHKRFDKFK